MAQNLDFIMNAKGRCWNVLFGLLRLPFSSVFWLTSTGLLISIISCGTYFLALQKRSTTSFCVLPPSNNEWLNCVCVSFHCRVAPAFNVVVPPWDPGVLPSTGSHRVRHDWSDWAAAAGTKGRFHKGKPPIQRCKLWLLWTNSGAIHTEAHGNRLPWEVGCNIPSPPSGHLKPRRPLRTASLPLSGACCFPLAHLFPRPSWALWWDFGWGDLRASRLCIHTPGKRSLGPVNAPSEQDLQPRCPLV